MSTNEQPNPNQETTPEKPGEGTYYHDPAAEEESFDYDEEEDEYGDYGDEYDYDGDYDADDLDREDLGGEGEGDEDAEEDPESEEGEQGRESDPAEGEGGESGDTGDSLKNGEGGAERAKELAEETKERAKEEIKEKAQKEIAKKAGEEVAKKAIFSNPWVVGGIVAVLIILVLILLVFMAFMGYGDEGDESRATGSPSAAIPADILEYCTAGYDYGFYTTEEAKRIFGSTESEVRSRLVWVDFPVAVTGRVQVHEKAAPCFEAVGKEIVASKTRYVMVNHGTFNWRLMRGGTRLSMHSFGIAIDINAPENCFRCGTPPSCKTDIPPEISEAFKKYGFNWGAEWRSVCDAMHFEWHGAER